MSDGLPPTIGQLALMILKRQRPVSNCNHESYTAFLKRGITAPPLAEEEPGREFGNNVDVPLLHERGHKQVSASAYSEMEASESGEHV
jgi:hypothetical protein